MHTCMDPPVSTRSSALHQNTLPQYVEKQRDSPSQPYGLLMHTILCKAVQNFHLYTNHMIIEVLQSNNKNATCTCTYQLTLAHTRMQPPLFPGPPHSLLLLHKMVLTNRCNKRLSLECSNLEGIASGWNNQGSKGIEWTSIRCVVM